MSSSDPDAFVVIHHPPGHDPYGVGPFPPDDHLAEALLAHQSCTCRLEIVWIAFPPGVVMGVEFNAEEIIERAAQIDGLMQAEKDRLN